MRFNSSRPVILRIDRSIDPNINWEKIYAQSIVIPISEMAMGLPNSSKYHPLEYDKKTQRVNPPKCYIE